MGKPLELREQIDETFQTFREFISGRHLNSDTSLHPSLDIRQRCFEFINLIESTSQDIPDLLATCYRNWPVPAVYGYYLSTHRRHIASSLECALHRPADRLSRSIRRLDDRVSEGIVTTQDFPKMVEDALLTMDKDTRALRTKAFDLFTENCDDRDTAWRELASAVTLLSYMLVLAIYFYVQYVNGCWPFSGDLDS